MGPQAGERRKESWDTQGIMGMLFDKDRNVMAGMEAPGIHRRAHCNELSQVIKLPRGYGSMERTDGPSDSGAGGEVVIR